MPARRLIQTSALVLGTGYVLFFFSERMFWSLWRPSDDIGVYGATWLVYALLGYALLATIRCFRVRDLWALFLAGAIFGWLAEGVFAMTMFGDASLPFPLTIAWTGLAWHAPISVVLGWYGLRRVLQVPSVWPGLGLSLLIGAFWGFWAVGWGLETPPFVAEPLSFLLHVLVATLALGASQWAITWGKPEHFHPSRLGLIVVLAIIFAFFGLVTVPTVPWSPALIVPLFGILIFALARNRAREHMPDALASLAARVPPRNLAGLSLIPIASTAVYSGANTTGLLIPSHQIVCAITTTAGFVLFAIAVFKLSVATKVGFRGRYAPLDKSLPIAAAPGTQLNRVSDGSSR